MLHDLDTETDHRCALAALAVLEDEVRNALCAVPAADRMLKLVELARSHVARLRSQDVVELPAIPSGHSGSADIIPFPTRSAR